MYFYELKESDSFVRKFRDFNGEDVYLVHEEIKGGKKIVTTTSDPLQATIYSFKEAVEYIYNHMTDDQKQRAIEVYKKKETYTSHTIAAKFSDCFEIIKTTDVSSYGDMDKEMKLLTSLDFGYMCNENSLILEDVTNG